MIDKVSERYTKSKREKYIICMYKRKKFTQAKEKKNDKNTNCTNERKSIQK